MPLLALSILAAMTALFVVCAFRLAAADVDLGGSADAMNYPRDDFTEQDRSIPAGCGTGPHGELR